VDNGQGMHDDGGVDAAPRVAVVTGATGGIGKEIARGLARRGYTVVIGARSLERGKAVGAELSADVRDHGRLSVLAVDVADLVSVREFAADVIRRWPAVDVLVNNAGAWFTERRTSPQGHELTLATNVLGPHLLTEELVGGLRAAPQGRVVNIVSSITGNYDADDLQYSRRPYDGFKAYGQSKQALTMLTWGLAARLAGTGVTANAALPGFVRTDFNRNARGPRVAMINLFVRLMASSPAKGADTPVWVATAPELATVTGSAFAGRKSVAVKHRDEAAIADLERRCTELERSSSGA
jgi:NAD(P)-dependent dehydrogenase (short-subunit alcohol dehydrogenase family)